MHVRHRHAPGTDFHACRRDQPFWGCFIALVTTAFGFIARMFLIRHLGKRIQSRPRPSGAPRGHRHLALRRQHHRLQPAHRQDRVQIVDDHRIYRAYYLGVHGRQRLLRFEERRQANRLSIALLGQLGSRPRQWHRGSVHQPGCRDHVQQGQDQMAQHPARRLARRPGCRRHGDHLH